MFLDRVPVQLPAGGFTVAQCLRVEAHLGEGGGPFAGAPEHAVGAGAAERLERRFQRPDAGRIVAQNAEVDERGAEFDLDVDPPPVFGDHGGLEVTEGAVGHREVVGAGRQADLRR